MHITLQTPPGALGNSWGSSPGQHSCPCAGNQASSLYFCPKSVGPSLTPKQRTVFAFGRIFGLFFAECEVGSSHLIKLWNTFVPLSITPPLVTPAAPYESPGLHMPSTGQQMSHAKQGKKVVILNAYFVEDTVISLEQFVLFGQWRCLVISHMQNLCSHQSVPTHTH